MAKPRIPGFMELGGAIATPHGFIPTNSQAGRQFLANEGAADVARINAGAHRDTAGIAAGASMYGSAATAGAHMHEADVGAKSREDVARIHAKGLLDSTTQQGFNRGYEIELRDYLDRAGIREAMSMGGQEGINRDLGIYSDKDKKKPGAVPQMVATPADTTPAAPMGLDAFYEPPASDVATPAQAQASAPISGIQWNFGPGSAVNEGSVDTSLLDRSIAQRRADKSRVNRGLAPLALPGIF